MELQADWIKVEVAVGEERDGMRTEKRWRIKRGNGDGNAIIIK